MDERSRRYAAINLPHARTIVFRIARSLTAQGAFGADGQGGPAELNAALDALEEALEPFEDDPPEAEAVETADRLAELARGLIAAIESTPYRGDRLGQSVRNLFECLGLGEEGARLSLRCGESPDSMLR